MPAATESRFETMPTPIPTSIHAIIPMPTPQEPPWP